MRIVSPLPPAEMLSADTLEVMSSAAEPVAMTLPPEAAVTVSGPSAAPAARFSKFW